MADIFNNYDESGYRDTMYGNRSSRTEDNAIVYNMRFKFPAKLPHGLGGVSDQMLVNAYDDFAMEAGQPGHDDDGFLDYIIENWLTE